MTRPIPTIERDLARAQAASTKASEARAALPPGSSRARVTSANARWARAAEERDRLERELAEAKAETPERYRVRYYDPRKKGVQSAIFRDRDDAEQFAARHRVYARPSTVEVVQ